MNLEDWTTKAMDPIAILATEFPSFVTENLAKFYYTNGGDLPLTIKMFTKLNP